MSRWKAALLVLGVLLVSALAAGGIGAGVATTLVTQFANRDATVPSEAPDAEERELGSSVLGESRPYTVFLPDFYARDAGTAYPLLVVLDGRGNGEDAAHATRTLDRAGLAPGHLVVAVHNVPRGRSQDLLPPGLSQPIDGTTGGGDRFLAFIEAELLPELDSLYRTDGTRLFAGHSFGGLFAAYVLLERPRLFDGVFALSPSFWVEDGAIVDDVLAAPPETAAYFSIGDEDGPMRTHFDRLAAAAAELPRWRADVIEGSSHAASYRLSLPAALAHYWELGG